VLCLPTFPERKSSLPARAVRPSEISMSAMQIFYSSSADESATSAAMQTDSTTADPSARAALAAASRIVDDDLLDELVALGIRADTIRALGLVPLAAVAWADGRLDEAERRMLLAAARDAGLDDDGPGRRLLELCLATSPPSALRELWRCWVGSASATLPPGESRRWRDDITARARRVAEAAGGFKSLLPKVSVHEAALLDEIGRAFAR
jgi:hypothetical protein